MADRQLLEYSLVDIAMLYMIGANEWTRSQSARHCLLAETSNSGSTDLRHAARVLRLILISFMFDLYVAYEAAKANRNPFTVYLAVLNQQLCKMKQDGKHSQKSNTNLTRGSDLGHKMRPRPCSCVRNGQSSV